MLNRTPKPLSAIWSMLPTDVVHDCIIPLCNIDVRLAFRAHPRRLSPWPEHDPTMAALKASLKSKVASLQQLQLMQDTQCIQVILPKAKVLSIVVQYGRLNCFCCQRQRVPVCHAFALRYYIYMDQRDAQPTHAHIATVVVPESGSCHLVLLGKNHT